MTITGSENIIKDEKEQNLCDTIYLSSLILDIFVNTLLNLTLPFTCKSPVNAVQRAANSSLSLQDWSNISSRLSNLHIIHTAYLHDSAEQVFDLLDNKLRNTDISDEELTAVLNICLTIPNEMSKALAATSDPSSQWVDANEHHYFVVSQTALVDVVRKMIGWITTELLPLYVFKQSKYTYGDIRFFVKENTSIHYTSSGSMHYGLRTHMYVTTEIAPSSLITGRRWIKNNLLPITLSLIPKLVPKNVQKFGPENF